MSFFPDPPKGDMQKIISYWVESEGDWQPIKMIENRNIDPKGIIITVHNGNETDVYNEEPFLFSSNKDGSGWMILRNSVALPLEPIDGTFAYVKARKGLIFALTVYGRHL